jgi:hydrogenase/urease accessory protein HupE
VRCLFPLLALFASAALLWPVPTLAHPLTPAALVLEETAPLRYRVSFRRAAQFASLLELKLPAECARSAPTVKTQGDQRLDEFDISCKRTLEGQTVRILGLSELELSALVHIELANGESARELLAPYRTSFVVPERSTAAGVLRDYIELGASHLMTGWDHLLFVFCLLWLVSDLRRRLLALTAFTVGHSITLCLSALSVVTLPQPPVEIGIAASLIVLALELLEPRAVGGQARFGPFALAAAFGLLHGLGFASALSDAGLPAHAVPLSLFGFNLGIELAQIAVVLALSPLLWLSTRMRPAGEARLRAVAAYAVGSLAAMWCIERALVLF